jgi:hypothetical protein
MSVAHAAVLHALDARAARGEPAQLWWRDDDAVDPSAPLDRLLRLSDDWRVPLTLAVIPQPTGAGLAMRLTDTDDVTVALHGWAHADHAAGQGKKQELGPHRPATVVLGELAQGLAKLRDLHGARFAPVLVPPWNRIAPDLLGDLPGIGIVALSAFGPVKPAPRPSPLLIINTHVDVMDWRGTRGGRDTDPLLAELAATLHTLPTEPIGILTHHLVHDAQVWAFLDTLFALTRDHPGCRWTALPAVLSHV